ncbi:MAG: hypothetical protein WAX12_03910 [Candidatus Microthrix subdominans]
MRDEPTSPEPSPLAPPPPPRLDGYGLVLAAVASLVFLVLASGVLWWVLRSSGTASEQAVASTTQSGGATHSPGTAAPARTSGSQEPNEAASPGQTVTLPGPATTAADATPTTAAILARVGPLTPARISGSNTLAATPRLACTGGSISYFAEQLIDGTDLGWGASSSDGTGQYFDVSFDKPVHLSTVGITPGYLRQASRPSNDCEPTSSFGVNRLVNAVEWSFDDGTSVVQRFEERPKMQLTSVDATTTNIRMTILETTRPPGADDDTVISEASFTGS